MSAPSFWKLFGLQFHRISTTTERVREIAADLRRFPERPWRALDAKFVSVCPRCHYPVRGGEKVCWLPAAAGAKSETFHWPCAPKWLDGRGGDQAEELRLARALVASERAS